MSRLHYSPLVLPITLLAVLAFVVFVFALGAAAPAQAPEQSSVRVYATAGEPYVIEWPEGGTTQGTVAEGQSYRDHTLQGEMDGSLLRVTKGTDPDGMSPSWDGELYAVLYTSGEATDCRSVARGDVEVPTASLHETSAPAWKSTMCDSYRYFAWFS